MKKNALIDVLAYVLPIVVLPGSFAVAAIFGEPEIFSTGGIVRYSWVMWLFVPVYLLPILLGIRRKRIGEPYKHYFLVTVLTLPLLLIFGSYRFAFVDSFDYETDWLFSIERTADVDLPDQVKMVTQHYDNMEDFDPYYVSRVKITDSAQVNAFEKKLAGDQRWVRELPSAVKGLLPSFHQLELRQFDYFLFYNITSHTYNTFPTGDCNNCVLLAYDSELNCLIVLHGLVVRPVF